MNPGHRFAITQEHISHLNACSAQKMTREQAAKELGVSPRTMMRAIEAQGLSDWMSMKFPKGSGGMQDDQQLDSGEIRKLKPEEIAAPLDVDREHIYVRSASMPWRKCA